jgi:hypothetical protein
MKTDSLGQSIQSENLTDTSPGIGDCVSNEMLLKEVQGLRDRISMLEKNVLALGLRLSKLRPTKASKVTDEEAFVCINPDCNGEGISISQGFHAGFLPCRGNHTAAMNAERRRKGGSIR